MAGSHVTLNESVLVAGSHRPSFQMTTFVGFGGPAGRLSGFGPARTDSGIAGRSGAPPRPQSAPCPSAGRSESRPRSPAGRAGSWGWRVRMAATPRKAVQSPRTSPPLRAAPPTRLPYEQQHFALDGLPTVFGFAV